MSLNIRNEDTRPFARTMFLEGRLDTTTAGGFDSELDAVVESPIEVLVLDLSQLEYVSSAGIRSLFRAKKIMNARAGKAHRQSSTRGQEGVRYSEGGRFELGLRQRSGAR